MASNRRLSVVQYIGENASTCGYCHSQEDTSVSSGLYCHSLRVEQYQQLVDRGWRRSGCYLYKPNMQRTCCPQYTIRLDVNQFSASKVACKLPFLQAPLPCCNCTRPPMSDPVLPQAQKHVLRKWERFLAGESVGGTQGTAQVCVRQTLEDSNTAKCNPCNPTRQLQSSYTHVACFD